MILIALIIIKKEVASKCCQDIKCRQAEQMNSFTHSSLSHPHYVLNQALKTILTQTFVENICFNRKTERVAGS